MRKTNIEVACEKCAEPFLLFSDDNGGDRTICWNYCPHCGERNDIWMRFLSPWELKHGSMVPPYGLGPEEGAALRARIFNKPSQDRGGL